MRERRSAVSGRGAGSITAALFLAEFSEDTPWVHLDIAGTFMSTKEKGYKVKGATGTPDAHAREPGDGLRRVR